jgi:hypothetical protein
MARESRKERRWGEVWGKKGGIIAEYVEKQIEDYNLHCVHYLPKYELALKKRTVSKKCKPELYLKPTRSLIQSHIH